MKKFLLIFLILPSFLFSQENKIKKTSNNKVDGYSGATGYQKIKGKISGKIKTNDNNRVLEYATVSLTSARNSEIIEGTITDSQGRFRFDDITIGKYEITISYIGYEDKTININTSYSKPDYEDNNIKINVNSKLLSEITIEEQKAIYETKIDKIIYNAENDDNGANEDATDVLRKAPLLSVDFDGNVELRGSRQIKFLLNGKASSFLSGDLSSALQMIPADQIKSVEIVTSPGAKYDAEGDAGIVNIITQKKIIDGYKASLDGSFGTRNNKNGFNLTLGKGKFSMSARGNAWYSWPREGTTTYFRQDWDSNGDTNILTNNGISESQWIGYGSGINMLYNINSYNSISSDIKFRGRNFPSKNTTTINYKAVDTTENYNFSSYLESTNETQNISWSTDYTKNFKENEKKELSISYQLGNRIKKNISLISENNNLVNLENINKEQNFEHTFQLDYSHPVKDHLLEMGSKIIIRDQEMDYQTDSDDSLFIFPNEIFNYIQTVNAFYLSSNIQLKNNYNLLLGTRYELTNIKGEWNNNSQEKFSKDYKNILPNISLSKKFNTGKSIKISYNTRISRPSSRYINTNTNISDNKNITVGNPDLTPSTTQQLELGFNSFGRIYQGSYYIYYKQNYDLIESFLRVENDTSKTTYENIGNSSTFGLNYYGSIRIKKFTFRSGFNLYSYQATDNRLYSSSRSALLYNYNFGISLKMKNNWKAEGYGFMRSPSQTLQGSSTSFSMMSFGLKKEFKNKRGSIGLRIIEPFAKDGEKIWITQLNGDNFNQISERRTLFTSIGISFKYIFGKISFKANNKKSKIKNDDVSEESNPQY